MYHLAKSSKNFKPKSKDIHHFTLIIDNSSSSGNFFLFILLLLHSVSYIFLVFGIDFYYLQVFGILPLFLVPMILTLIKPIFMFSFFNVYYFVSNFFNFTGTVFVILISLKSRNNPNPIFSLKNLNIFGYLAIVYFTFTLMLNAGIVIYYLISTIYLIILKYVFKKQKSKSNKNNKIIIDNKPKPEIIKKISGTSIENKKIDTKESTSVKKNTDSQSPEQKKISESHVLSQTIFSQSQSLENKKKLLKNPKSLTIETEQNNLQEKNILLLNERERNKTEPTPHSDVKNNELFTPSNQYNIQPMEDLYSEDSEELPKVPLPNSNVRTSTNGLIKHRRISANSKNLYSSRFSALQMSNVIENKEEKKN
jgi:hypothetical protein